MSALLQRTGVVVRANPAVDTAIVNAFDSNNGRIFVSLRPRNERPAMSGVLESLRRESRAIAGVKNFPTPS